MFKKDIRKAVIYGKTALVSQGLNLLTISIIIRALGNEQFGIYQYALGIIAVAIMVGNLGTDAISFREFSMPLRHACGALPRVLLLRLGGSIASLAVTWLLVVTGVVRISPGLFAAVAATATVESFLRVGTVWHRGRHLAWEDFWTSAARSGCVLLLVYVLVPRHPDPFGIALAYGAGAAIILGSLLWQWRRILRVGWRIKYPWRHLLGAAPTFIFLDLGGSLIAVIPIFVLGQHLQFADVGRFSVYVKYLAPFSLAATLYVQSLQPSLVLAFHRSSAVRSLLRRGAGLVTGAGLLGTAGVLTLGAAFVYYLGKQQPLSLPLLFTLAIFPVVFGWSTLVITVLSSARNERWIIVARSLGVLACALSAILWREKGALMPAIAAVVTCLVEFIAGLVFGIPRLTAAARGKKEAP